MSLYWINELLSYAGFQIARVKRLRAPDFNKQLRLVRANNLGFEVFQESRIESHTHPQDYIDLQCSFASVHIARLRPKSIVDIGSYRKWIIGVLSSYEVTSVDIRERRAHSSRETVVISDASKLALPDASCEMVTSLCCLHHIGLGRYGNDFDLEADRKAFREMVRILKPGGRIVFTTTLTRRAPAIGFNAQRIYARDQIRGYCKGLELEEETFINSRRAEFCSYEEVTERPREWDVYCGCWRKPA